MECNSKDDEQIVKEYFAKQWLPYGEPFARVKRIRDTSHIKLKEHRVQTIASSWKPNYEAVENGSPRFNSETYGNWHINPRFKYKRVWRELIEEEGVGTCDVNDTWQEQMADEIVKNRGAIVTGCGGCGKSRILELVKKKFEDLKIYNRNLCLYPCSIG